MRILEENTKITEAKKSYLLVYNILAEFLPKRQAKEFAREISEDRKYRRESVLDKYLKGIGIQAFEREAVAKQILREL